MDHITLRNILAAVLPGGIERQEKDGQLEQAAMETLPIKLQPDKEEWEKIGFKFGDKIDDLFQKATLPPGWSKKPTDHSMWTDIVDDKGATRGTIFYKAAFYDMDAFANLN